MQYNCLLTFTRESDAIVSDWHVRSAIITNPAVPVYLQIQVAGITSSSNLYVTGTDENSQSIEEIFLFESVGTRVSQNLFKTVSGVTHTWTNFNINISSVDAQGQPVMRSTSYGPYPSSMMVVTPTIPREGVGAPGFLQGQHFRMYIEAFEPQNGDAVSTSTGLSGICHDVYPAPYLFSVRGWIFFLVENPS